MSDLTVRFWKAVGILCLEILLIVPQCGMVRVVRDVKSPDAYWADTNLNPQELESLLEKKGCAESEKSFLACANAVSLIAEKYSFRVDEQGRLLPLEEKDLIMRANEKERMKEWEGLYGKVDIDFLQTWKELSLQIPENEKAAAVALGLNGFLAIFKDPHSYLIPIKYYEDVIANPLSKNISIGFAYRRTPEALLVRKVMDQSLAEQVGLKKGDRIVTVNGVAVSEILPQKVNEIFKMDKANRILVKILRGPEANPETKFIEILKREVIYPSVVAKLVEKPSAELMPESQRVGIVTLHKFSKDTCALTERGLISMIEQGAQGIILDLRDNPGGQVEEAACVANLFLPRGVPLFETRYMDHHIRPDYYVAQRNQLYRGPVAVLINSGSASAAEIVAGVLKEHRRATLVGERTFGKGSFQDGRLWMNNPKIAHFQTEGLYYFPSGWTPQLVGIEPDLKVDFNMVAGQREEDLYYHPIAPLDAWGGPQTLSWLTERRCDLSSLSLSMHNPEAGEDIQVEKAQAILECGVRNGRNGAL